MTALPTELSGANVLKFSLYSDLLQTVDSYLQGLLRVLNNTCEPEEFERYRWKGLTASELADYGGEMRGIPDYWTPSEVGTMFKEMGLGPVIRTKDMNRKNVHVWPFEKLVAACRWFFSDSGDSRGDIPDLDLSRMPSSARKVVSDKGFTKSGTEETVPFIVNNNDSELENVIAFQQPHLKKSVKDIFIDYADDVGALTMIECTHWDEMDDGLLLALIEFSKRLIDFSDLHPHSNCLTIDHANDSAGYPNLTAGLVNRINDMGEPIIIGGYPIQLEQFPCHGLPRLVCMAAHPIYEWKITRGTGGNTLEDQDYIAHHKCRTRNCVNPLHLLPVDQQTHKYIHQFANELDHPCLEDS